ncbi:unnamed protein product [Allacma fusca]|uniref:Formiminotransferase C-terminal subdomain domain-containing protein n=1 Tax=Allacma fusca TaxID=39272 RepID=A0A8J2PUJ9_9HEXA|nr:unnamed protein product [Allacma fusca]
MSMCHRIVYKLKDPVWKPNYGPEKFQPSWGASMVGARNFLLAYNINMLSTKEQAHRIALDLREAGRGDGKPGKFKALQGIGWWLEEHNIAQISFNLTDQDVTSLHAVYEESVRIAKELKLSVVGSELVGLVPLSALLTAANFYIEKENLFVLDEEQKVRLAIERLGLNSLYQFDPKERIIEWKVRQTDPPRPLLDASVARFIDNVKSRSPAPGGGSVAALVGALGASLGSMVGLLTFGKRQWEHLDDQMRQLIKPLYEAAEEIQPMIEADTVAFDLYVEAIRKTKSGSSIEAQAALWNAINVPLGLAKKLHGLWPVLEELFPLGNPNCLSDIQVGVKCIETGIWGARCNVLINCQSLENELQRKLIIEEIEELWKNAQDTTAKILKTDVQEQ